MNIVVIALLALSLGAEPDDVADNKVADLKKSIALLRTMPKPGFDKATAGVGFLVEHADGKHWMITCAHVVKDADAIRADFSDFLKFIVVEAYIDEGHDQALLKLAKAAPSNAVPFSLRTVDVPDKKQTFTVIGFARGVGPHVTAVPAAYHARIKGREVGIDPKVLKIDPDAPFIQVGVVGEPGASGSPMVDENQQLVGVYSAGWKGRSDIGYCSVRRTIADLQATGKRVQMNRGRDKALFALDNFERYNLRVLYMGSEERGANPTSMTTAGEVSISEWNERYLATSDPEQNRKVKEFIAAKFAKGEPKVIHVQSWPLNVGFLVPEGYEIVERAEPHHGYSLTISKPGSLYEIKLYSRPLFDRLADLKKDGLAFSQELRLFLADVAHFTPVSPGQSATRLGEAVIGPGSWPALYRTSSHSCLLTARTYAEPSRNLFHEYMFELCRRTNRFEVAVITYPLGEGAQPPDQFTELELILSSAYDLDLGLEKSRQFIESESLKAEFRIATPTPGVTPDNPGLKGQGATPPVPGNDRGAEQQSTLTEIQDFLPVVPNQALRPNTESRDSVADSQPPIPRAMPAPVELAAPNLGRQMIVSRALGPLQPGVTMLNREVAGFLLNGVLPPRDLIRNDRDHYKLAVPQGFTVNEWFDETRSVLTSVYEKPGVGIVRIVSRPIPWPWFSIDESGRHWENGPGMLQAQIMPHRREVLRLFLASSDSPALAENRVNVKFGWLDSADPERPTEFSKYRYMHQGKVCYRYRHYESQDGKDTSYITLYIIDTGTFLAVDFSIPNNAFRRTATPQERQALVELALIPLSLTLDQ